MKNDEEILKSVIAGGLIGGALGNLITNKNNKGTGAILGAIAGAALFGSLEAQDKAKKANLSIIVEEEHALYELYPDGTKKFIKDLPVSGRKFLKKYTLK